MEEYLGKDRKLYTAFMDLEKAYDRVDRKALWNVLKIYGVGRQLMEGIKAFYREAIACVKVDGELSDSFATRVGVRQGCVMSPWLIKIFMDGCIREVKAKVGKIGTGMKLNGVGWSVTACLFVEEGHLGGGGTEEKSTCVRKVLPGGEGWIKQGESAWTGRGGDFCHGHPLGGCPQREQDVRAIGR